MFWFVLLLVCVSHSLAQEEHAEHHDYQPNRGNESPRRNILATGSETEPSACTGFCALSTQICPDHTTCGAFSDFKILKTTRKTYYINTKKEVNWLEALRQCRLMGLQLATIPGQEEDDAIMNFKKQNKLDAAIWVGGTDLATSLSSPKQENLARAADNDVDVDLNQTVDTNQFYWIAHGDYINNGEYTNWKKKIPRPGCMAAPAYNTGKWYTKECHSAAYFMCESLISRF